MPAKCFVIGTGRCGTEMLVNVLNCHPSLLVLNESMFLLPCLQRYGSRKTAPQEMIDYALSVSHVDGSSTLLVALESAGISKVGAHGIFDQIIKKNCLISAFDLLDIVGAESAKMSGKAFWAEKCPDAGYFTAQINREWPETSFIHIVRDGYATARSMQQHHGFMSNVVCGSDTWVSLSTLARDRVKWELGEEFPLSAYLDLWGRRYLFIEEELNRIAGHARILRISYEKILDNPIRAISEIYSFLEIDCSVERVTQAAQRVNMFNTTSPPSMEVLEELYNQAPSARAARALFEDHRLAEDGLRGDAILTTRAVRVIMEVARRDSDFARAQIALWAKAKDVSISVMERMILDAEPVFKRLEDPLSPDAMLARPRLRAGRRNR